MSLEIQEILSNVYAYKKNIFSKVSFFKTTIKDVWKFVLRLLTMAHNGHTSLLKLFTSLLKLFTSLPVNSLLFQMFNLSTELFSLLFRAIFE